MEKGVCRRSKLTRQQTLALALYLLIPMGCMIVQMLSYGLLILVERASAFPPDNSTPPKKKFRIIGRIAIDISSQSG